MAVYQFQTSFGPNHTVIVPPEIAAKLTDGAPVQVTIVSDGSDDDVGWRQFTAEQFLKGYSAGDAIYDEFPAG